MSSKLAMPPLTGMPPDVQAAFRAIAAWAKSSDSPSVAQTSNVVQSSQLASQRVIVGESGVKRASSISALQSSAPTLKNAAIIRSIFSNSSLLEPIQLNSSVVFQAGNSKTGVGIGAGGIIGRNEDFVYPGYDGLTFGISSEDGSFFFGPQVDDADTARKQIIFDVGSGVFQFGKDIIVKTSAGNKTLDDIALSAGYTSLDLQADLAAGVGSVIAGTGGDYRLHVDTSGAMVVLHHKDAVFKGTATAGSNKPALGITAAGIAIGYNRSSDGAWVDAVAIDSSGNASFAGTVSANSVISVGATCNGTAMSAIRSGALSGATAVQPAAIANMLTSSSSYILGGAVSVTNAAGGIKTGNVVWDAFGNVNGGSGIAITSKGIVGVSNNAVTFSVDGTSGAAFFKGNINGATGTFAGSLSTSGQVLGTGTTSSALGVDAAIVGNTSAMAGVVGYGAAYGVYGTYGKGTAYGVLGDMANSAGVFGIGKYGVIGSSDSGAGVFAKSVLGTSTSLKVTGKIQWGAYTYSAPNGSSSLVLAGDGTWIASNSHVHGIGALSSSSSYVKFQYSGDAVTWSNIYMRRIDW